MLLIHYKIFRLYFSFKTWIKAWLKFYICTTCKKVQGDGMQNETLLITYSFNVQMSIYFHSHKFVIGHQQVFSLKVIWIWMQRFFNLNWQLKVDHGKEGKCQVIWLSMYRVRYGHVTCSSKISLAKWYKFRPGQDNGNI